jgi:hypothetical protein
MRRALAIFVFVALAGSAALAQFTTVSGTVTDPNGLPYANGTISPALVISGSPTLGGFAYTPPTQPTGLSTAGSFTMRLADNTQLSPGGSTWSFTVSCAAGCIPASGGKGPVTFTVTGITISGASQSITATLTAAAPALSNISGGGGGTPGAPSTAIQFNNGGVFTGDANFIWNSNTGSTVQLPARSLTIGPTTNIGYYGTLESTPLIYSENTNTDLCPGCTSRGPFTVPYNFWTFLADPGAASAVELFNLNGNLATLASNTRNYTNELAAAHMECDHNGTGTLALCIGWSGEAFNLGNGTVTRLNGVTADAGTLNAGNTGPITELDAYWAALFNQGGGTVTNAYGFHVVSPIGTTGVFTNYTALQIDSLAFNAVHNPNVLAINVTDGNSNFGSGTVTVANEVLGSGGTGSLFINHVGSNAALTLQLGATNNGFYGSSSIITTIQGTDSAITDFSFGQTMLAGDGFGFSSGAVGSRDLSLSRSAGAILNVGSGALGSTAGTMDTSRVRTGSLTPTCTFTSGGGTSPSCAFGQGSSDAAGTIIATTGTGAPAGTGTITLTFSAGTTFAVHASSCVFMANDGGAGTWAGLPVMKNKTPGTTSDLFTWTNQPAATGANTIAVPTPLATSTAYWIDYHCWAI